MGRKKRRAEWRPARGRHKVLLPAVLLTVACLSADAHSSQQPSAAVRLDPIQGIADAFKTYQVVMLPGGHGSKPFHDLLLSLARDRRIQAVVNDIVVEFRSSRYQDLIDRFQAAMRSQGGAQTRLADTTIPGVTNDGPYVEPFDREMAGQSTHRFRKKGDGRRVLIVATERVSDFHMGNHVPNR